MRDLNRHIIFGMQILLNEKLAIGQAVVTEQSTIKAIIPKNMISHHLPATLHEFSSSCYLVPGFIDLHIHGANDKDIMDGNEEAMIAISKSLAAEGVTAFLPTTMTATDCQIETVLTAISAAADHLKGAAVLGIHLEGPFISKEKTGAQYSARTQMPNFNKIQKWQSLSNGMIKLITLAPELPDATNFIQSLQKLNIIPAIGHTNATFKETCLAINSGCSYATHLFNAMRGLHQREPGTVGALLLKSVKTELIVDGIHLHPAIVDLVFKIKGKENILLVTDAMRAKCLGDGNYKLGEQTVIVTDKKALLPDGITLAGSTLRMNQAIKNMIAFTQCSLSDAVMMASLNPAKVLRLEKRKGSIEITKDADLVVLDNNLNVKLTMREGEEIYCSA